MTPERLELAATVRALLAKRADSAAVRAAIASPSGFDDALWQMLCEQIGLAALAIPEELGGAGFSLADALAVVEELGYALAPSPVVSSLVTSAALIKAGADDLLGEIAAGEIAALAWAGPMRAAAAGEEPLVLTDGLVSGVVPNVIDGDLASILVVAARTETGIALCVVDPADVKREPTPAMDLTLRLATLTLEGVPARVLLDDATAALEGAHLAGCLAVAALQVGTTRRALDMTVAYSKDRVQFGRQIGSFQALKHRMADMLVLVEMARSALWAAAEDESLVHIASTYCTEALNDIASETVQLHGGIAITWEHDAHLIFKRAHSLGQLFGAAHQHRALVAL